MSVSGCERIVRCAFDYARQNGRKKVTAVHKANIMKYSDGLYLHTARKVAEQYPDIEFEDRIVDNMCMQLVQKPELYDVLVLPNLYGDILSDLGAGLVGGLGVAPGMNVGPQGAVFEATHGSAPKYKGLNKVNPTAVILSGMLMLKHLGETDAAERLERAVASSDRRREVRHLRSEAPSRRSHGRRHPGNGRGHLPAALEVVKIESQSFPLSTPQKTGCSVRVSVGWEPPRGPRTATRPLLCRNDPRAADSGKRGPGPFRPTEHSSSAAVSEPSLAVCDPGSVRVLKEAAFQDLLSGRRRGFGRSLGASRIAAGRTGLCSGDRLAQPAIRLRQVANVSGFRAGNQCRQSDDRRHRQDASGRVACSLVS